DRPALVLILAPGVDVGPPAGSTPPEHLRYDVVMRLEGQLPVEVGRALPALVGSDGSTALRLETSRYGRLLGEPFELSVVATDLAGNRAEGTYLHQPVAG